MAVLSVYWTNADSPKTKGDICVDVNQRSLSVFSCLLRATLLIITTLIKPQKMRQSSRTGNGNKKICSEHKLFRLLSSRCSNPYNKARKYCQLMIIQCSNPVVYSSHKQAQLISNISHLPNTTTKVSHRSYVLQCRYMFSGHLCAQFFKQKASISFPRLSHQQKHLLYLPLFLRCTAVGPTTVDTSVPDFRSRMKEVIFPDLSLREEHFAFSLLKLLLYVLNCTYVAGFQIVS